LEEYEVGWLLESYEKNHGQAVKMFRKAADQNYAEAQSTLGDFYYQGLGVAKDDVEAATWWRKAAEQNYANAEYNLGTKLS
jgi:uncharacterized protein